MPGKKSKYTNKNKKKYEPKNKKNQPSNQQTSSSTPNNKPAKLEPPPRKHESKNLVSCKTRDFLEEDPPLRGQNWMCISFLSPEDVIKRKDAYFFETYLKHFSNEMNEFWVRMIEKYPDEKLTLLQIKDRFHHIFNPDEINEDYVNYYNIHSKELEDAYYEANDFQTSIRGVKVRGVFDNEPAARNRCEVVKGFDHVSNVFVATVGAWCPWSPNPEEIEDQEHAETQLNTLAKNYKENVLKRNQFYQERKQELLQQKNKTDETQPVIDDENTIIDTQNDLTGRSNGNVCESKTTEADEQPNEDKEDSEEGKTSSGSPSGDSSEEPQETDATRRSKTRKSVSFSPGNKDKNEWDRFYQERKLTQLQQQNTRDSAAQPVAADEKTIIGTEPRESKAVEVDEQPNQEDSSGEGKTSSGSLSEDSSEESQETDAIRGLKARKRVSFLPGKKEKSQWDSLEEIDPWLARKNN